MLTIAGGIVLGFLGLGLIRALFGGPTRNERIRAELDRLTNRK